MGIVRFALRFPHTFYVLAALILFLGSAAICSMPTDIFPEINIPVVTIIWQYTGLSTPEMEQRVTTYSQYALSAPASTASRTSKRRPSTASRCRRSSSSPTSISISRSRRSSSATNSIRALMPPGIQPPIVVQYNASSVPVLQIGSQLRHAQRAAALRLRHLPPAPAARADPRRHAADAGRRQVPPDHGRYRSAQAAGQGADAARRRQCGQRAEPDAAVGHGQDRRHAIHRPHQRDAADDRRSQQHPGQVRQRRHRVRQGRRPGARRQSPCSRTSCATDGRRSVLLSIIKNGNASTLAVVNGVKQALVTSRAGGAARHADQGAVRSVGVRQRTRSRACCAKARSPPASPR